MHVRPGALSPIAPSLILLIVASAARAETPASTEKATPPPAAAVSAADSTENKAPDDSGPRVRARAETFALARRPLSGGAFGDALPVVLLASGQAEDLALEGLSLSVSFWGLLDAAEVQDDDQGRARADLRLAFARYRPRNGIVDLVIGRQLTPVGVSRLRALDAARGRLNLPGGLTLEGYGGVPVTPYFDAPGAWIGGGRVIAATLAPWLTLSGAFTHEEIDGGIYRQTTGGGLWMSLPFDVTVEGDASYDLRQHELAELDTSLGIAILGDWRVEGSYRRTLPALLLPPDSFFAVFSRESHDNAALDLSWRGRVLRRATTIELGGGAQRHGDDTFGPGARVRALVELTPQPGPSAPIAAAGWVRRPADWVVAEVTRADGPRGSYLTLQTGVHTAASQRVDVGARARLERFDMDPDEVETGGGGSVYSRWRPLREIDLGVLTHLEAVKRPRQKLKDGLAAMVRVAWGPSLGGSGVSSGATAGTAQTTARRSALQNDWILFNHAVHSEKEIDCLQCHPDAIASQVVSAAMLPGVEVCDDCHETDHDTIDETAADARLALASDMEDCAKCHHDPIAATSTSMITKRRHLIFRHAPHASDGLASCASCHAEATTSDQPGDHLTPTMETCRPCHSEAFDRLRCTDCHDRLTDYALRPAASLSHDTNFLRQHGRRASGRTAECTTCHDQAYCSDCHGANEPLVAALRLPDRSDRQFMHSGDYATRHAYDASQDGGACLRCHGVSSCETCHRRAGIASGGSALTHHPPGYADPTASGFHGADARTRIVECAACHDSGADSTCLRCHAVGGSARGSPHPAGWVTSARRAEMLTDKPCVLCHTAR